MKLKTKYDFTSETRKSGEFGDEVESSHFMPKTRE